MTICHRHFYLITHCNLLRKFVHINEISCSLLWIKTSCIGITVFLCHQIPFSEEAKKYLISVEHSRQIFFQTMIFSIIQMHYTSCAKINTQHEIWNTKYEIWNMKYDNSWTLISQRSEKFSWTWVPRNNERWTIHQYCHYFGHREYFYFRYFDVLIIRQKQMLFVGTEPNKTCMKQVFWRVFRERPA